MLVDPHLPANTRVVRYLRGQAPRVRPLVPISEADDAYYSAGAHPMVVEYLWDELAKKLPEESRCLLYGAPVLVQPVSGVVLAHGMGMGYALRLPPEEMERAVARGWSSRWMSGPPEARELVIDFSTTHGPDWVLGRHEREETAWCRTLFARFAEPPPAGRAVLTPATPEPPRHPRGTLVMTIMEAPHFEMLETVNADEETVEFAVHSLSWQTMTFLTLSRDDVSVTLSGSRSPDDGFCLDWMQRGRERIARDAPDLPVAIDVLRAFTRGDKRWARRIAWV